jgi:hypothetical protein
MLRGCIGVFIAFFVVPLIFGILVGVATLQWAVDREFWTDAFASDAIFDVLYSEEAPRFFNENVFDGTYDSQDQAGAALALALREVIPRETLRDEVRAIIDQTFDYLEGETNELFLQVDVTNIKQNFLGSEGDAFANVLAENLPACDGADSTYGDTPLINCVPAEITREEASDVIREAIPLVLADIPDVIDLMDAPEIRDFDFNFDLSGSIVASSVVLLCIGSIFWLFNAIVGGGGSRRGLFLWLGVLLLLPGVVVFGMGALIGGDALGDAVEENIRLESTLSGGDVGSSPEFQNAVITTTRDSIGRVGGSYTTVGGAAVAFSVLLLIVGAASGGRGSNRYADPPPVGTFPPGQPEPFPGPDKRKNDDYDSPIQGI